MIKPKTNSMNKEFEDIEFSKEIKCPKCQSTQLTANKKGFSGTQAVGGALLTGGIGLLAGTIGSNSVRITCLSCGHQFKPGDDFEKKESKRRHQEYEAEENLKRLQNPVFIIIMITVLIVFVLLMIAIEHHWI